MTQKFTKAEHHGVEAGWGLMVVVSKYSSIVQAIRTAGRQYDVLSVKTADSRDMKLYFDITAFLDTSFHSKPVAGTTAIP